MDKQAVGKPPLLRVIYLQCFDAKLLKEGGQEEERGKEGEGQRRSSRPARNCQDANPGMFLHCPVRCSYQTMMRIGFAGKCNEFKKEKLMQNYLQLSRHHSLPLLTILTYTLEMLRVKLGEAA